MDEYDILKYLQEKKNVILTGAPGTGKSRLINLTANKFENHVATTTPINQPGAAVPIPMYNTNLVGNLPMLQRSHRKVFRTTLHQNSKYRDFLTGIVPDIQNHTGYKINKGILFEANEFAMQDDSAALLIIDELNRGPAVEVFGGSIVAIEPDKRLSDNNTNATNTQYFDIIDPVSQNAMPYAFSPHLYILGAMNQADVSVAPLDIAFLRRWFSIELQPDYDALYRNFNVTDTNLANVVDPPRSAQDVFLVAIKALEKLNEKIIAGRGEEYQIGQGIFFSTLAQNMNLDQSLDFILDCWSMIYTQLKELFFGDTDSLAYMLNAGANGSPYNLVEVTFSEDTKHVLTHSAIDHNSIFALYLSLIGDNH